MHGGKQEKAFVGDKLNFLKLASIVGLGQTYLKFFQATLCYSGPESLTVPGGSFWQFIVKIS